MLLSSASAMPDTPSASAVAITSCLVSKYCKIVEGEINPHGHCIAFKPKPGK
jgi:hypothetical protein